MPPLTMRPSRTVVPALLLALLVTACPKSNPDAGGRRGDDTSSRELPPRTDPFPDKPQKQARDNPQARAALDAARTQARAQPDKKKAAELILAVRKTYPDTTAGQDALYEAGVLYSESRDYPNARRAFNELLFENPLHPQAGDAKKRLGYALIEVGAYRDAYQTLSSLADRAEGQEKAELLAAANTAAERAGLYAPALKLAVREAGEAQGAQQAEALARVEALIEKRADFRDVAEVLEDTPTSNPAWPLLTFKLARIYYHLRDWDNLAATLDRFLRTAPSHPFAQQARELQARATRTSVVSPRKVGVLLPMTGRYKAFGEAVLRGIRLGLEGSDVELVVKDTQGDAALAGQAVESLVFEQGAIAAIGPVMADDSRRAALMAEELQLPLLTLTRQEGITDVGPYVFRNMLTNTAQAKAIAQYAMEVQGHKSFAVLYPNVPYGVELANGFWDEVVRRGGQVRGAEHYDFDQTTFTEQAKKLVGRYYLEDRMDYLEAVQNVKETDAFRRRKAMEKAKSSLEPVIDFDAIFIPDQWQRVSLVAPALAVEDIVTNACDARELERIRKTTGKKDLKTVTLLGTNMWSSTKGQSGLPQLIERGGKFVNCSVYVDGFFADSERKATQRFVEAYRKRYADQADPGLLEAHGYDSARIVRQVLEKTRPTTRNGFRDALADVKGFEGATGVTSFDEKREAVKPLFLMAVDPKGVTELEPPKPTAHAAPVPAAHGS